MKIVFLLHNAYAIGGTVRSTLNLAGALAARHEVEIVSVFRSEDRPVLGVNRKVRLVPLVDERRDAQTYDGENPLMARPSTVVPPAEVLAHRYTELTDERLRGFLDGTDADVVVATRPALVVFLARHGSRRYLRVGQEHLSYDNHVPDVRTAQNEAFRHLDAFVTVSAQDAADHREHLPRLRTRITDIPNAAPRPKAERSDVQAPLVVAAGRLMPVKRYDLLIEAFAKVVAVRPEWRLRIYGQGPERATLRAAVDAHRLNDHVFLMGPHPRMETEWAKASVVGREFGLGVLRHDDPGGHARRRPGGGDRLSARPRRDHHRRLGRTARTAGRRGRVRGGTPEADRGPGPAPAHGRGRPGERPEVRSRRIADQYERLFAELREARIPTATKVTRRVRRALGALLPQSSRPRSEEAPPATPPAAPPVADDRPRALRPKAGCTTDSSGGVRITVNASGVSGESLTLVLRHRHGDDETRVPLDPPTDPKSPWTANLSHHQVTLAEGRWDLHVERAEDGTRRRLKAGLVEQRGLLSATPVPGKAFAWWIPYATKDGYLALRTFRRPAHVEATALRTGTGSLTVEGTLHGAELGEGAVLIGVSRDGRPYDFESAATPTGERTFRAGITSLPRPTDADKPLWDLFLRPAAAGEPVRVGRILGDIVDRKATDKHPSTTLATSSGPPTEARFFFTITNDVAISAP